MNMQAINIVPVETGTGNITPLLHEIRHALLQWLQKRREATIDLRSIPLLPTEQERLLNLLGVGEIQAQFTAMGKSEVTETRYPGVWVVTHYDESDKVLSRFIEITNVPQLLRSHPDDMLESYDQLEALLARDGCTLSH